MNKQPFETMYNLFVSGDENSWEGTPFEIDLSRCVREYTDEEIKRKYQELSDDIINVIKQFPCVFAYESPCEKDPKFGFIRAITKRKSRVLIEYEIININPFLSHQDLDEMSFKLDIGRLELNRTHWAIKNINLSEELQVKEIILLPKTIKDSKLVDITKHLFDVSLSFPGDVRDYVESVAKHLEQQIGLNSCFYDNNYKAQLARPSLDTLLQNIYKDRSKLVVVFIGHEYQKKNWCGVEFRAIRDIIFSKQHDRIMYIRMDDGQVDGVGDTDGYIDANTHLPEEIANFIVERIKLLP
ncbi:MAG: TIR domain-containing protein [Bacteroidota bacterium]